jgi:hypothetical protein
MIWILVATGARVAEARHIENAPLRLSTGERLNTPMALVGAGLCFAGAGYGERTSTPREHQRQQPGGFWLGEIG